MGRKASKASQNVYYLARCKASESCLDFTSREKTSLRLGIERSRLARIELDKIIPYAEEVAIMAKAYNAPYLNIDYCENLCPIGMLNQQNQTSVNNPESIERLVLKFISSTQYIDDISKKLVDITKDGVVTPDELDGLAEVIRSMNSVSSNINAIHQWIDSNPTLKNYFKLNT